MAIKRKKTGEGISIPGGIVIGATASLGAALVGAMFIAYMVSKETVSVNGIGIGAAIILVLAAAVGAWIATAITKRQKLLVAGLTGLSFFLLLLGVTIVFFDGAFSGVGKSGLMILFGAGITLLPGICKKPRKNKIKIPAYR